MTQINPGWEKVIMKVEEENTRAVGKVTFMVGSNFFFRVRIKSSTR